MSRTRRKSTWGMVVLILAVIALSVGATVAAYSITDNFSTNIFVNQDNLVHSIGEYETVPGNNGSGLVWTVDSFGRVKANGKTGDEDSTFVLGTVIVEEEDYYTLTGAPEDAARDTYYIEAVYKTADGSTVVLYSDFLEYCTSPDKLPEGTEVTLTIVACAGCTFENVTFAPTFVAGKESGRF